MVRMYNVNGRRCPCSKTDSKPVSRPKHDRQDLLPHRPCSFPPIHRHHGDEIYLGPKQSRQLATPSRRRSLLRHVLGLCFSHPELHRSVRRAKLWTLACHNARDLFLDILRNCAADSDLPVRRLLRTRASRCSGCYANLDVSDLSAPRTRVYGRHSDTNPT